MFIISLNSFYAASYRLVVVV